MEFTTDYNEILALVDQIDPIKYSKTRNYLNGAVTKLSPYISRGVISTRFVFESVMSKGYKFYEIEKFIQELGWRDFFQLVWKNKMEEIDTDLKNEQQQVLNSGIATAIVNAETQIEAIDKGITDLYETGYMHNHLRMYTASIACNVAGNHWRTPAQWMYYHLLDADWASNALSWQWVVGAYSSKKYFANQANINKYCNTNQQQSFLNVEYHQFENMIPPHHLTTFQSFDESTNLPISDTLDLNSDFPLLIYNFYNLDPLWHKDKKANRILLLEPNFFNKYPSSKKVIDFILALAKNINGIKIFVGSFNDLKQMYKGTTIFYKEHPTTAHYQGSMTNRDWLAPEVSGYYSSFFSYWKKAERELKKLYA